MSKKFIEVENTEVKEPVEEIVNENEEEPVKEKFTTKVTNWGKAHKKAIGITLVAVAGVATIVVLGKKLSVDDIPVSDMVDAAPDMVDDAVNVVADGITE